MRPDDFFIEGEDDDAFGLGIPRSPRLDLDLLRDLRAGRNTEADDVEAASALANLLHDELEEYGTSGNPSLKTTRCEKVSKPCGLS